MVELLRHGLSEFDQTRRIGPVEWPHHDLFYVHRGVIEIEFPATDSKVRLTADMGVLIWPGTLFRGAATTPTAWGSVQHFAIHAGAPSPFADLVGQRNGFTLQATPLRELTRDVERALALARQPASVAVQIIRPALLAIILAEGGFLESRDAHGPMPRINVPALESWLHANLHRNPGVSDLAHLSGLSPSRFRAVFRDENGSSAGSFIKAAREDAARHMLVDTPYPLKAIAAKLGYGSPVAFSRAFKVRAGVPPGEFRRRHSIRG